MHVTYATSRRSRRDARSRRSQSPREEFANTLSHGIGFALALAALPVLVMHALPHGALAVVGESVYGGTLALLFLASTIYHSLGPSRTKQIFRVLDHSAIFLLIAGTYTPFTLGVLRGPWGWSLFGVVWLLALAGITLTSVYQIRYPKLSTAVYLMMGWLILIAVGPLARHMRSEGWIWLLAGGAAYTLGVAFYAASRLRYGHCLWHMAVLAGATCHFVAVLRFSQ